MSTQAVTWAMDEAPMLLTPAGKPDTTARGVLIARAERADKHGRNSRAAIEDVMWRTGFDRSTVQRAERRLEAAGLLIDAGLTHDGLTRWNLDMSLRRDPAEREKLMAAVAEKKAAHAAGERKRRADHAAVAKEREDFKSAREDFKFAREDFKSAREDSVLPEPSLNRQEPSMNSPRGSAPPRTPPRCAAYGDTERRRLKPIGPRSTTTGAPQLTTARARNATKRPKMRTRTHKHAGQPMPVLPPRTTSNPRRHTMTEPKPYTITVHWHPSTNTGLDALDEPTTETAPDWPTARSRALKLTTLAGTIAVVVRDPDGELIANWDQYSNLWREPRPRPKFIDTLVDLARARVLAAEYRDNPTRARAHNAAQTLGAVLDTLEAVIARTFAITDENDRLTRLVDEARKLDLLPPRTPLADTSPLGKAARRTRPGLAFIDANDERQHPAWPPIDDENPTAPDCVKERLQYNRTRCAEPTCERCWLGGPDNWPRHQLATGGIVNPTTTHRIGES